MTTFLDAVRRELPRALTEEEDGLRLTPESATDLETAFELARVRGGKLRPPGADPREGDLPIDMRFIAKLHSVDETSRIAHVSAGLGLASLESRLRPEGLSLACRPHARDMDLGTWVALGAPGRRPLDDDPVDQVLCGADVLLADGRRMRIRPAPRRAVGPDLLGALLGGRSRLGVALGLHLVLRPRLERTVHTYLFATVAEAESACAWARGRGLRAARSQTGACAEGGALWVELSRDAMEETRSRLLAQVCATHAGRRFAPEDAPPWPDAPAPAFSAILDALAERLDPAHVLS